MTIIGSRFRWSQQLTPNHNLVNFAMRPHKVTLHVSSLAHNPVYAKVLRPPQICPPQITSMRTRSRRENRPKSACSFLSTMSSTPSSKEKSLDLKDSFGKLKLKGQELIPRSSPPSRSK